MEQPQRSMIQRPSGLIVPASLETQEDKSARRGDATAYDLDGRRRVVMTAAEQKLINLALRLLRARGFAVLFKCHSRTDGKEPCTGLLKNENEGELDNGYGCVCSRIHFIP